MSTGGSTTAAPIKVTKEALFARKATGLTRDAGVFDGVMYNLTANWALGFAFAFNTTWLLVALPGLNLVLSAAIALVVAPFITFTWVLLSAAMPRTGGEYVFNTRLLHPAIGFMGSWVLTIGQILTIGLTAYWTGPLIVSPMLAILGLITGNHGISNAATTVTSHGWTLALGTATIAVGAGCLILGLKPALKVLKVGAIAGLIGFVLAIVALLLGSPSEFRRKFGEFASGGAGAYHGVITSAKQAGLALPAGHPVMVTLAGAAILATFASTSFWSAYMSGEIRRGGTVKRQALVIMVPTLIGGGGLLLGLWLLIHVTGYTFLTSINYLNTSAPAHYPLSAPPYSQLFPAILAGKSVLGIGIVILFLGWAVANVIMFFILVSRILFAWSFDRLLPLRLAKVSGRFHSPVNVIMVVAVLAWLFLLVFTYGGSSWFLWITIAFLSLYFTFAIVGVAALAFPFIRGGTMFRNSPANVRIGRFPVIVATALVTIAYEVATIVVYYQYPSLGLQKHWIFWTLVLGMFGSGLVYFYLVRYVRSRQGVDLDLVYAEIPPE